MQSYKEAGVDIDKGNELIKRLQKLCPTIGGFGGLYPLGEDYLVAGTDGVGTKLKLAFALDQHSTVGIDLVAMCVNDIITTGARPLFFLDYFATGKLDVDRGEAVLKGILQGCAEARCPLLGGETAEMPGFYQQGEYDLAGFAVGLVKKSNLIDGKSIRPGDLLVGVASSGLHSNGFSLVRKVLQDSSISLSDSLDQGQASLGELLLRPTKIYVELVDTLQQHYKLKGIAHITGGGLLENVPRMLPEGCAAVIRKNSWTLPYLFRWLQTEGEIEEEEMYRTFNMGIGLVMVLSAEEAAAVCRQYAECSVIGQVQAGDRSRVLWS